MMVRTHTGYREFAPLASYDHQVGIAVRLREKDESGLPSNEECLELGGIEDTLCASLESDASTLLVAIITTGGMREFVFYTRIAAEIEAKFESLRQNISSHEMKLLIQPDKGWNTYSQL